MYETEINAPNSKKKTFIKNKNDNLFKRKIAKKQKKLRPPSF